VQAYIAPTRSGGRGNVWVKIQSDGFSGGTWGVDRIRRNGGKQSVTFPRVAAGEYLVRPEILALHEGNRVGGAQFYMACIQFKTSGSGSVSRDFYNSCEPTDPVFRHFQRVLQFLEHTRRTIRPGSTTTFTLAKERDMLRQGGQ
jgi:hypothetical protein